MTERIGFIGLQRRFANGDTGRATFHLAYRRWQGQPGSFRALTVIEFYVNGLSFSH